MKKLPALLIVGVYLALAASLSLVIPLGEAADEVSHRAYVHELAVHRRLPVAGSAAGGEMYQPPLYYMLLATVETLAPSGDLPIYANPDATLAPGRAPNLLLHPRTEAWPFAPSAWTWHLLRLCSVLLGAVTVLATALLAAQVFPGQEHVAWGSAAFLAFLPGFLFLSAALNNDTLINAIAAVTLWQLVRQLKQPAQLAPALATGLLLGLAVWAKMSGLALWGAAALVYLWRARSDGRTALAAGAACLALAVAVSAPWFAHNVQSGIDPLGWQRVLNSVPRQATMTADDWRFYVTGLYTSFWGRFGGATHLRLPSLVYALAALIPLCASAGLVRAARHWLRRGTFSFAAQALALLALFCFAIIAAHIRFTLALEGADLARHLFPGLAPLALATTLGASWRGHSSRGAVTALASAMLALAVGSVVWVALTFTPPSQRAGALPGLENVVQADFGAEVRVTDYSVGVLERERTIIVEVHWQALRVPEHVYWLLLRVVVPEGGEITRDGVPAAGWPTTDRWRAGDVYSSRHVVTLPSGSPAGVYGVELGLHRMGEWTWLPVQGRDLLPLGQVYLAP